MEVKHQTTLTQDKYFPLPLVPVETYLAFKRWADGIESQFYKNLNLFLHDLILLSTD